MSPAEADFLSDTLTQNRNPPGDRQRPQCGTCADAGIVCEINNNRLARGPKKGDLKALRSRIGKSETCQESGALDRS
jgi:hypothetical protein